MNKLNKFLKKLINFKKQFTWRDVVLTTVLGASLFFLYFFFFKVSHNQSCRYCLQGQILGICGYLTLIITLIILLLNKRIVFVIVGWTIVLGFYIFLFSNKNSETLLTSFKEVRNLTYFLLLAYLILHIITHGVLWLIKKKRKVFTKRGVINFILIFLLITFSLAFVYLAQDIGFIIKAVLTGVGQKPD